MPVFHELLNNHSRCFFSEIGKCAVKFTLFLQECQLTTSAIALFGWCSRFIVGDAGANSDFSGFVQSRPYC